LHDGLKNIEKLLKRGRISTRGLKGPNSPAAWKTGAGNDQAAPEFR
jgi:hypothetical protein